MPSLVNVIEWTAMAVAGAACCVAAAKDLRLYRIDNRYPLIIFATSLIFDLMARPDGVGQTLALGAGVLLIGMWMFSRRWMGGGDAKLLAAVAFWCPPALMINFALVLAVATILLALALLSPLAARLPPAPERVAPLGGPMTRRPMPWGVAISAAGLWLLGARVLGAGG